MKYTVPPLYTDRLILRAITLEDIPSYTRHFADYQIISQMSNQVPWPYPEDGVRQYLTSQLLPYQGTQRWDWGIFLKSKPQELIGGIGIWREGCPEQRGFWLGKKFWGQGLMTEAVEPVHEFAFLTLGFKSIILSNALGNIRSRRIKEKTGAKYLGTMEAKYVNTEYTQAEIWELSFETWVSGCLRQASRMKPNFQVPIHREFESAEIYLSI